MRTDKRASHKAEKKPAASRHRQGVVGYSKKGALLEEAITLMNAGKYGRSSAALKELLALDPQNAEARRLFATLHLRLGSLVTAREAFESLANEAIGRQDYWLAESLLREYLAAGPRCIPFLELLAHVNEEKGDAMAAVSELGKAIEILLEDPDPDNPKKPAQLYAKVRELSPASPTAFQFATTFDIQTGEFRIPHQSIHDDPTTVELPEPVEVSEHPVEDRPADETAPSEQLDESPATESGSPNPLIELTASNTPAFEIPSDSESLPIVEKSETAGNAGEVPSPAPVIPEATPALLEATEEPASLLSRMPWEHVADSGLQIVEPEPAALPEPPAPEPVQADQIPVPPAEPVLSTFDPPPSELESVGAVAEPTETEAPISVESETPPVAAAPSVEETVPLQEEFVPVVPAAVLDVETVDHVIQESTPSVDLPVPASEEAPAAAQPASFTWKEIFDSAWSFTVGTTAPAPSMPEREPGLIAEQESEERSAEPVAEPAEPVVESVGSPVEIEPPTTIVEPPPVSEVEQPAPRSFSLAAEEQVIASIIEPVSDTGEPPVAEPPVPVAAAPVAVVPPATETVEPPVHWDTGAATAQLHRPSDKSRIGERKQSDDRDEPAMPPSAHESTSEPESELSKGWEAEEQETAPVAAPEEIPQPVDTRPDWAKASDWIVLDQPAPAAPSRQPSTVGSQLASEEPSSSRAASAVDVLFESSQREEALRPSTAFAIPRFRPRLAVGLARLRVGIISVILSGFSTTKAFVLMCVTLLALLTGMAAAGLGVMAVVWMVMEEQPGPRFQSLTSSPQRQLLESKKNGFLLLMGFGAPAGTDPVQAGYERKPTDEDVSAAQVCMAGRDAKSGAVTGASSNVIDGWFKGTEPLAQLKAQPETVTSTLARETTGLARYQQWLSMSFEDWGFGRILSPDCPRILFAHRLYLLEGFHQDTATGVTRLEKDIEAWRGALSQSKTLMIKMLAAAAVQDDVLLASGLLTRSDTDAATVSRLTKVVRPLDQMELSVRWPMQSHFAWGTGKVGKELKNDGTEDRPFYVSLAASMPLPVQRRANAYADYYEAANRAVAEGRFVNLPKPSQFLRANASNPVDYIANPLEHIVGIESLPSWDPYVGRMVELDAQLRLASLQAWVRRGPQDGDVLTRLAKAGQAYYDPFTGLPMLVNQQRHLLYSVGQDGKDQEGDPHLDVVVAIPAHALAVAESKRTSK